MSSSASSRPWPANLRKVAPAPLSGEARAASWRVFALVLLSASWFYQSSGHNEAARFDQIRSITEHGEWWIDRYAANTFDIVSVGGHTFPNKAPGTTLLGLAPWRLTRFALSALPLDNGKQLVLTMYLLTIFMAAVPTALISLMILRFLARSGWTTTSATLVAIGYGVGSIAFPWATTFFGHQLAAYVAFGAFYLIWDSGSADRETTTSRLLLAGLMIGFLPVIEYPAAIASGLIVVYAFLLLGIRAASVVVAGAIVGVLPLPLYNAAFLGSPGVLSYSFYKEESLFAAHRQGFMGVSWPRLGILNEILFKAQRGLFHANPWLTFCLAAPFLIRRLQGVKREFALAGAIFVAALLFNSGFGDSLVYWGGAFSFGPRHILFALPFAALLAAAAMRSRVLAPIVGTMIVGTALLMLTVAAVDPRLPYEPASPFLDFYFPLFSRGLFSINPKSAYEGTVLFGGPGAWNLGRASGLPASLEILPLGLLWAGAAFFLINARSLAGKAAQGITAALVLGLVAAPGIFRLQSASPRETGLCQAVSADRMWPYFSDHALQGEPPGYVQRHRAPSPAIALSGQGGTSAISASSRVAVTFSGYLSVSTPGWHLLRLETIGQAVVYVDGTKRLKIDGPGHGPRAEITFLYLSSDAHEVIVRYMSDRPLRSLKVEIAAEGGSFAPLSEGLFSGVCR